MRDPVPCVRLTVQSRALDIDVLVLRVEVDVSDRGRFVGLLVLDADLLEEGRGDEIHILHLSAQPPLSKSTRLGGRELTCPALGYNPIITSASNEPMAPESSFPGIPATVSLNRLGIYWCALSALFPGLPA